jgi:betaine-aldehyde dehydrogenase
MMAVRKWVPANAAGNAVVLKPSDTTPVTTVWMAELMSEFLPDAVINVVTGDRDAGALLVSHKTRPWCRSPAASGPAARSPRRPPTT